MNRRPGPICLVKDARGAVSLEFLISIVPIWTFALCILQLALIARADLMVRHSADAAARAAAVVLPDDPHEYGGEPEMSVHRSRLTREDLTGALAGLYRDDGATSLDRVVGALSGRVIGNLGRSRLNTIRLAAHVPLMPLAPINVGFERKPTLRKALGDRRSLASALYYQPFALAVTFPNERGETVVGPEITVRVTYAYQCTVPLARRIVCSPFRTLAGEREWAQALFAVAQSFVGGRFRRLQHDTTLMIHGAPYQYRPRGS